MHNQYTYHDEDEEETSSISLDRVLYALRRRWKMIAGIATLAVIMSLAIVVMLPARYDASAVVQIDPRKKTISNIDGVLSELKADGAVVDSEAEIIASRTIVLRVIDALDLRNDPEFTRPPLMQRALQFVGLASKDENTNAATTKKRAETKGQQPNTIESLIGPKKIGATSPEKDEVSVAFLNKLKVTRVGKTLLIKIRFSSEDPVKAAKIANTIAEVYLNQQLVEKHNAADLATSALERKLSEIRKKLTLAEQKVEDFKAKNDIFNSEGQILSEKHLARLQEQTVIARNNTASSRAKYLQAKSMRDRGKSNNAIADVLESHTVRLLKEQLAKATRKYAELRTKYGHRHPSIKKIQAEVADARAQLNAEIDRLVVNLGNEYEIAVERETELAKSLASLKKRQVDARKANVSLMELQREASTSKELYEALLARYKQTSETQTLQLPDARIVEQADAPLHPAAPKRKKLVLLASIAGLVAAISLALALEFATFGVGRPEDVEQIYELAHLSSLPRIEAPADGTHDAMRFVRMMVAEPAGPFADAIRGVRREIDLTRPTPGYPRVIIIAGSLPGEGSSITASNLAHQYAMTGNRVLLIDGDMRHANLSRKLSARRHFGLSDVLMSNAAPEAAILRDVTTGLNFMPATGSVALTKPSTELLTSPLMAGTLNHLRGQFDTIIIDAPPLLPVIDGRILADYADQILFLTTWRNTPKQLAKRALKTLQVNQQKILGVVVNQVSQDLIDDSRGIAYEPQIKTPLNASMNIGERQPNVYANAA